MKIRIRKEAAVAIGLNTLERFGASELGWRLRQDDAEREIDLASLSPRLLKDLQKHLESHAKLRGVFSALAALKAWIKAQTDPDQEARNAEQMMTLVKAYLAKVDGHRVFRLKGNAWLCYYVDKIVYHPKQHHDRTVIPPRISFHLVYEEFGGRHREQVWVEESEVRYLTPSKVLSNLNLYAETPEQRKTYLEEREKFLSLAPQIGRQLELWGVGVDDLDGNPRDSHDHWYWKKSNTYTLGTEDDPGRGVVDVFYEKPKDADDDRDERVAVDLFFWDRKRVLKDEEDDDADNELDDAAERKAVEAARRQVIEIPVHPYLAVFDMARHLRLRVHVQYCQLHVYDTHLADKLVLPPELKALVTLLIEHREGGFQDIVKGKGGGAVVMLAGPPGTGKTLTAEVYAETEQRALYSVQCSQLGTTPEELEGELLKCFSRCARWNAVMLLDEADVYVHRRGESLDQNAIVGVFLRVLEYQAAVLFLTTNRPEDVDDAIASRCVARLTYAIPSPGDQAKIWKILTQTSGASLKDAEIAKIVKASPTLTGRDVKNLLKLAMLMKKDAAIEAKDVEFVKQFKATQ